MAPLGSSPRAWGCFRRKARPQGPEVVFPTCVGVFLCFVRAVRGGVESSPRAWGCFPGVVAPRDLPDVFPTCVGVFLRARALSMSSPCLPHVRGGVSTTCPYLVLLIESSPRAWGCFSLRGVRLEIELVFPTCVGVFLTQLRVNCPDLGLPHVRGGVSFRP